MTVAQLFSLVTIPSKKGRLIFITLYCSCSDYFGITDSLKIAAIT